MFFDSARKILIALPHPDDEAYFCAGTISRLTNKGVDVKIVLFSKGEASTLRYGINGDLGAAREKEFAASCAALGVTQHKVESLPDGMLTEHKVEIEKLVTKHIQEFSPDLVITFEPYGAYGHPDHIAISEVCTKVVPKEKLVYVTIDPEFRFSKKTKAMSEKEGKAIKPNLIITLTLRELRAKRKSLRAHKSQTKHNKSKIWRQIYWFWIARKEYFYICSAQD